MFDKRDTKGSKKRRDLVVGSISDSEMPQGAHVLDDAEVERLEAMREVTEYPAGAPESDPVE